MKKVEIELNIHSDREKQKALKAVSGIQGVDSLSMDMEANKMTIIGNVDPVKVICKLRRRSWCPQIISVGPKEEPKTEEPKVDEKKVEDKKDDVKKCDCGCGHQPFACQCYRPQTPCYPPMNYVVHCVEEYPPSCVIS